MAYLVLALGALLSVGGGLSVFYGAGIVEVERGWTGVIAGATSLTGGIVTIALGLILKTLLDLRAAGPRSIRSTDRSEAPVLPLAPQPAPVSADAATSEADLEGGLLAAFLTPTAEPTGRFASETIALPSHPQTVGQVAPVPLQEETAFAPLPAAEDPVEPAPAKSRSRVSLKTLAAEQPPREPEPGAVETVPVPAMDDWLDRAFSSLDSELAGHGEPERTPNALAAPGGAPAEAESETFADHAVAELEPHRPREIDRYETTHAAEPKPASQPTAAAQQSAIIGRYEADGTSYVMFADGSIEAQSEAGIHRFQSMTELKAFIEGTG